MSQCTEAKNAVPRRETQGTSRSPNCNSCLGGKDQKKQLAECSVDSTPHLSVITTCSGGRDPVLACSGQSLPLPPHQNPVAWLLTSPAFPICFCHPCLLILECSAVKEKRIWLPFASLILT